MRDAPDRELVAASLAGDVRAFGALVERHHGAAVAVAFAITRDRALGEDIAQDAFVVAWTRLAELKDPGSVRAWLCNIARNQAKNELRRRTREAAPPDESIADQAASPADTLLARQAEEQVRAALAEVPETYREPLVLFYWHEQSIASVASALAITEQAAQKRISRARGFVEAGLATRVQEVGRGRRPAKAAAAAIVALLATRAAPAAAAARVAATTTTKAVLAIAALSAVLLAVGFVVWQRATRHDVAAAAPGSGPHAGSVDGARRAQTRDVRPAVMSSNVGRGAGSAGEIGRGGFAIPDAYEVTELAPTHVAVNLSGGKSSVFLWEAPPAPTFARHVRGRVVDEAGTPVAGAVVVIGADIRVTWGSLTADQGGTTSGDGAFDVVVHRDDAVTAMALHPRAGWSSQVAIAAGRGDAQVEIRIARPGTITGDVRRARTAVEGNVRIRRDGDTLDIDLETDARGHFEVPLLAPGTYRVTATPKQLFAGGASKPAEQVVTVESGGTAKLLLDIAPGTLVVVTLHDRNDLGTVEYFLVPGARAQLDAAALRKLSRSGEALSTLFGGKDVTQPMQFHDVAAGTYTLCVDRRLERDNPLPVLCQPLEVTGELLEVSVAAPR